MKLHLKHPCEDRGYTGDKVRSLVGNWSPYLYSESLTSCSILSTSKTVLILYVNWNISVLTSLIRYYFCCVYVGTTRQWTFIPQCSECTQNNRRITAWEMPVISVGQLRKAFPFSFSLTPAKTVSRITCISIIITLNLLLSTIVFLLLTRSQFFLAIWSS